MSKTRFYWFFDASSGALVFPLGLRLGNALALAFQHDLALPARHTSQDRQHQLGGRISRVQPFAAIGSLCTGSQPSSPATTQHSLEGGSLLPHPHRSFTGWTAPASPGAPITGFYDGGQDHLYAVGTQRSFWPRDRATGVALGASTPVLLFDVTPDMRGLTARREYLPHLDPSSLPRAVPEAGEPKRGGRFGTINDNGGNNESSDNEPLCLAVYED